MNKGFTLIELLVVVLIIGILAAIALPQYQKAVERSRMAEAIQILGDFATAQSIYYMQHNEFARNIGQLNEGDIQFSLPTGGAFTYEFYPDWIGAMRATRSSGVYEGGILAIAVGFDGSIGRLCDGPEGFCPLAEFAGYQIDDDIGYGVDNNEPAADGK